jgi:hypothetical protein
LGLERYVEWVRTQGPVTERFAASLDTLRSTGAVQPVAT